MRFRNIFLGLGTFFVLSVLLLSDPGSGWIQQLPFGAGTLAILITLSTCVLYVGFLHFARKALVDYIDLEIFFTKAYETPLGAGLALIAVAIMMISVALVMLAAVG